MHILQSIIMGIVQGLSEFLPISSSAHLVITSNLYKVLKGEEEVYLSSALDAGPECNVKYRAIADKCLSSSPYTSVGQLQMSIAGSSYKKFYVSVIAFLIFVIAILSLIIIFHP